MPPASTPPIRDPRVWPALVPAIALMLLGLVFILAPGWGAALFGLPAPAGEAVAWLAVVGIRDLAFGAYVLALAAFASRDAVALVLGITALIPLGDIALLLAIRGAGAGWHLLPHLASCTIMAAAALWVLFGARPAR